MNQKIIDKILKKVGATTLTINISNIQKDFKKAIIIAYEEGYKSGVKDRKG